MNSSPELAARVEALEAASAHQDRALAELSDAVAAQWGRIDLLTREILRLREEMRGLSQTIAPEKPPPHY
jgi:SlyX protein